MLEPVIDIRSLAKSYGAVRALDGLTLAIAPGPVGLLGPNGAGKTTLLKVLLGLLVPDGGSAYIAGHDPRTSAGRLAVRRAVGFMPEGDCLIPGMSAVELVCTLGRITGLSPEDAMTRTHEVLDYVGLDEARYRTTEQYSTGMKQRLKLAQALVHDPELLLLDEPTNGLDPKGRRHMLELVHDLGHHQGKNVLLCSHLLPDVERTCRDVVVLQKGRVVLSGSIAELTAGDGKRLRIELQGERERFEAALSGRGFTFEIEGKCTLNVQVPSHNGAAPDADELFALAHECGARLTSVIEVRSSLEDVFMSGLERGNGA